MNEKLNSSIGKRYKKNIEPISGKKFVEGMFGLNNPVGWVKDIVSLFNLRKLIIYAMALGIFFGWGWYKGRLEADVHFDLRGKQATIQLNEHFLKIEKDGTAKVVDKEGNVLKTIKVKDIPELRRALRPFGLQLKPFVTAGGSISAIDTGFEAGAGVDFFKWYKSNLNAFLTNKGIYLGLGYQITDNFDILLGTGKGYTAGDTRIYLGGKWKF